MMLRQLGIGVAMKWFVIACVGLAVWRGFDGDIGAIVDTLWLWVQRGADLVTNIWTSVNAK